MSSRERGDSLVCQMPVGEKCFLSRSVSGGCYYMPFSFFNVEVVIVEDWSLMDRLSE